MALDIQVWDKHKNVTRLNWFHRDHRSRDTILVEFPSSFQ